MPDSRARTFCRIRWGAVNTFYALLGGAVVLLIVLGAALYWMNQSGSPQGGGNSNGTSASGDVTLFMYCAAGIRPAVEQIAEDYEKEKFGVPVQLQFGGSQTLYSQLKVSKSGDLYLAADDSYIELGRDQGLIAESVPLALMRPVIAVKKGNPKKIKSIDDLLREDVTVALGNPDQAAVGRKTRKLLKASGQWEKLKARVTKTGVFKPTVPEVAIDVTLGVDAGIVWDATVATFKELEAVRVPELDAGTAHITVGVMTDSEQPTEALKFARYLGAKDKGLNTFKEKGFEPVEGDHWAVAPELTFFCGAVNRRAVEEVIKKFEQREGIRINTVYNGCGILTGQMRGIMSGTNKGQGFPDIYMACDRYYLDTVQDWFQPGVDISDTEVVIAVPKGNPKNIRSLEDLTKEGMRVSMGRAEQCTIGVLTDQLLKSEGLYEKIKPNVVTEVPSSALLIPTVVTGSVDATLAYATDTRAEADKLEVIRIPSQAATAVQPFSISKSSKYPHLAGRFYDALTRSRDQFEAAGFHWRLEDFDTKGSSE